MNPYELIDRLCGVVTLQADIIRKQQAVIMQHGIEMEDSRLKEQLKQMEDVLDFAEYEMRTI